MIIVAMNVKMPTQVDGYIRVSRVAGREGESYISPKVQREAIEAWATYKGVKIAKWFTDEDQSGGTQERPGLVAIMKRIEEGKTGGIACWRLNRFARNVTGAIHDVERIEAAGAHLALVEEDIDTTGPFGRMILTILLAVATLERDNIKASWKTARSRAVDRGVKIGPPPIGYDRGEDGVMVPNKDAKIVKQLYRCVASEGISAGRKLAEKELPDHAWTTGTLRRLLASRSYLGEVVHGELSNVTAHKPIVTRVEWEAAQMPSRDYKRHSEDYPLSGVLVCASCKQPMVGSMQIKTLKDGTKSKHRVYRCKDATGYGSDGSGVTESRATKCEGRAGVNAAKAEAYVRFAWERLMAGEGWDVQDEPAVDVSGVQEALEEAEAELYAFTSDLTMRRVLGNRYHEELQRRAEAVDAARAALGEAGREELSRERITPRELVEDPSKLGEAARRAFRSIEVLRGRLPIEQKIVLLPYGYEDRLTLAPQNF